MLEFDGEHAERRQWLTSKFSRQLGAWCSRCNYHITMKVCKALVRTSVGDGGSRKNTADIVKPIFLHAISA